MLRSEANEKIRELMPEYPDYIKDFINSKIADQYSPNTILEYLHGFSTFINWTIQETIIDKEQMKDVTAADLETITPLHTTQYKAYLQSRFKKNKKQLTDDGNQVESKETLSISTIRGYISAIKVIYDYLATSTANINERPYISKNVMSQLTNVTDKKTLKARAEEIEDKLFLGNESQEYLDYIDSKYELQLSAHAKSYFIKNKERDLAINAIMLGAGLRLTETVGIDLEDLNFERNTVSVMRKGGKKDSVTIAAFAMTYLARYRDIRQERYQPDKYEKAFFLAKSRGQAKRITGNAIEKMVAKYSENFKVRVTPHKLRHTLATRLYKQTNSLVLTAQQLGHSSTSTTTLYTHIDDDATRDALNNL